MDGSTKQCLAETANKKLTSLWKSKRLYIMLLLFTASLINYIDRVGMSVAAPAVSKEFSWDPGTMGIILSAFMWAYSVFLVPMGWWADKVGPRKLNSIAVAVWSAGAMLTGVATNFMTMIAARLVLGAGEASTMPSGSKVVRQWFPIQERGLATALARSGAEAGPAIGMPIVALLVIHGGWRISFIVTGAIGFLWILFWWKFFRDTPQESSWLPVEEKEHILANTDAEKSADKSVPKGVLWRLLQHKTMWGLLLSQGCIMYTQYLILTWLPSYLVQVKHMQLMSASILSSIAFVAAWAFGILVCRISDALLTPERVRQGHRRTMVIIFMVLSSIFVFTTMAESPLALLIIITLVKGFLSSTIALNMTLTNDLVVDPVVTGSAFGLLLLGGNFCGSLAPVITGYIVKSTGSFNSAFLLAGVLIIIGALISLFMTRKPIALDKTDVSA